MASAALRGTKPSKPHRLREIIRQAGDRANWSLALRAWKRAVDLLERWGVERRGMIMHHDQDSVYTSCAWTGQLLLEDKHWMSYALSGAKDNPYMESFFSRFKQEGISELFDAHTLEELQEVIGKRINFYTNERYHSSLGYRAAMVFIQEKYPEHAIGLHT